MCIKYLVVDVDGTMTDGGIYYDENGNETKKFCVKDAAGFFAAHQCGIKTVILTGRMCNATTRRAKELQVDYLYQNIRDKANYLENFMTEHGVLKEEIGYIGDDLNDLESMKLCGYVGCPADACREIKKIADYISNANGGMGVIRDVVEHILRENDKWETAISDIYGAGI